MRRELEGGRWSRWLTRDWWMGFWISRPRNGRMGEIFAKKANQARGPVAFLIPLRGVSILDGDGQPFCDREADGAMFEAIKRGLKKDIPVVEMVVNINNAKFAAKAVEMMLD